MLRKESVSDALFEVLTRLMNIPGLGNHRLVGGTALALQLGHRISVDIDLFSGHEAEDQITEEWIHSEFGGEAKRIHYLSSPLGRGISWLIAGIKVDVLNWRKNFGYPAVETSMDSPCKPGGNCSYEIGNHQQCTGIYP